MNSKQDTECPIATALIHATALRLNFHEIQNLRNTHKKVLARTSKKQLIARDALLAHTALSKYAPQALLAQTKTLAARIIMDEPNHDRAATLAEDLGTAMSHQTKGLTDPYTQHPHPKHAAALACIHAARAHRAALQPPPYQNLPYHGAAALAYWADATVSRTLPELNSLLRQLAALD